MPPDGHLDRRDDQTGSRRTARPGGTEAETRSHEECYNDLRIADAKATIRRSAADHGRGAVCGRHVERKRNGIPLAMGGVPAEVAARERRPVDRSNDPPGSWRGEGDRFLKVADNSRVEAACDLIAEREQEKITPALRAIESQAPDRHLIGFDDRRKGRDRIKEKVADRIEEKNRSPNEAVSLIPDTIRYTFQYGQAHYTQGVWADIERLKGQGFELCKLKNSWSKEEYQGINSQWIDPDTGQRFEVQFHTRISFEAKQLTHDAIREIALGSAR